MHYAQDLKEKDVSGKTPEKDWSSSSYAEAKKIKPLTLKFKFTQAQHNKSSYIQLVSVLTFLGSYDTSMFSIMVLQKGETKLMNYLSVEKSRSSRLGSLEQFTTHRDRKIDKYTHAHRTVTLGYVCIRSSN